MTVRYTQCRRTVATWWHSSLVAVSGGVCWWWQRDDNFLTRSLDIASKTTVQHLTVCSGKSETEVTNNGRLRSRYCTVEANYWQTRSIARPLCDSRATCLDIGLSRARLATICAVPEYNVDLVLLKGQLGKHSLWPETYISITNKFYNIWEPRAAVECWLSNVVCWTWLRYTIVWSGIHECIPRETMV